MRRLEQWVLMGPVFLLLALGAAFPAKAAPYAALVMDVRSGEVLHATNAETRLHPASLTKMMTLYIAFQAVENGELSMDTVVTISRNAAAEPPSKLGLRSGQKIKLRYLVRAAAVKSANDAATAIGEAIAGSEAAFARRMTATAASLGMHKTAFRNAHGLTADGHLSTAHDMTILGRHLFYDYPEYYNLFSRVTTDVAGREVANTNRRFLGSYKGADGIKTGYTNAAGFNLVASAERDGKRIIATVFGGRSSAQRNGKVAELLDLGFSRAPNRVAVNRPSKPPYNPGAVIRSAEDHENATKTLRLVRAPSISPLPAVRPGPEVEAPPEELLVAMAATIEATVTAVEASRPGAAPALPPAAAIPPPPKPTFPDGTAEGESDVLLASLDEKPETATDTEVTRIVIERISTSGERHWGINIGRYGSSYQAERVLLQTALTEIGTLDEALRKVKNGPKGFEANFVGMTQEGAARACRRLVARNISCTTIGPS